MKLKGRFEKHEIQVGLSAELPLAYQGPEEKYTLADRIARSPLAEFKLSKSVLEFELLGTSDEFERVPDRLRCHLLINRMPDEAIPEVEEELRATYAHYVSLADETSTRSLPPPPKAVAATSVARVKL